MSTLDDLARVERELRATQFTKDIRWADTIAAYIAAQRERDAVNGWQPIESAPNTGEVVLFFCRESRTRQSVHITRADDYYNGAYWRKEATHWMPLPSPPNPKAKGFKEPTP